MNIYIFEKITQNTRCSKMFKGVYYSTKNIEFTSHMYYYFLYQHIVNEPRLCSKSKSRD
jgi:hypothetical protein